MMLYDLLTTIVAVIYIALIMFLTYGWLND